MDKNEILTSLRELRDQFGGTLVDEQVRQLDNHYSVRQNIEAEINQLLEKVKNDQNYIKSQEVVVSVEQLNDQLARIDTMIASNNATIANANYRIKVIDSEIAAANDLIAAGNNEIAEIEHTITTTDDAAVIARLNEQIYRNRLAIADLERDIETLTQERPLSETAIDAANRNSEEISASREQYIEAINDQNDRVAGTYIDENERQKDRNRILELQRTLNNHNIKIQLLSYDFASELTGIIDDLDKDIIGTVGAIDRVRDFYDRVPKEVFVNDFRSREQALEENSVARAHYEADIAALQDKLADENNYQLSLFAVEALEIDTEVAIARNDREIADIDREIVDLNNRLDETANAIIHIQDLRNAKERDYRALGMVVDAKADAKFGRQLAELADNKARLVAQHEQLKARIKEAEKRRKELEKQRAELAKNANNKDVINKVQMDEDRAQLEILMAGLAIVNRNKELLEYDPQLALLELINGKQHDEVVAPVILPEEPVIDDEIVAPVEIPAEEIITPVEEPIVDDDEIVAPLPLPILDEVKDDEIVAPIILPEEPVVEKEKDDEIIAPIAITDIHDATPELKEEAHKKKGALIVWIKRVTAAVLAGVMVVAAYSQLLPFDKNDKFANTNKENKIIAVDSGIIDGIDYGRDKLLSKVDNKLTIDDLIDQANKNQDETSKPDVTPTPEPEQPVIPTPPNDDLVIPTPDEPIITPIDPTPIDPTPVDPTPIDPTPIDPTPVDPKPNPNEVEIKVNEGETLIFNDGKNDVKVDLSDGENDPYITSTDTVGPEQSDAVHGLEYDFTDDGMSATVTVDKNQIEKEPMTEEQYEQWLETERENNGITDDLNELLGKSR